jgi:hypothetical protein
MKMEFIGGQPSDTGEISTALASFMVEHASLSRDTGIIEHRGRFLSDARCESCSVKDFADYL